jgi:putative ABC transport system permease protein
MLRAMLRDLRAHTGRIAMTLVAVVLGVTFVVATWVLSDSTAASLTSRPTRSAVDVVVQSPSHEPALTEEDLTNLTVLPGVTKATGVQAGRAALVGANGKLIPGSPDRAGTGWDDTGRFTVTNGRSPSEPDEIALSTSAANTANLRLGAHARVLLADGRDFRASVVGLFEYRALGAEAPPSVAFAPATAHSVLGTGYDRIELRGTTALPEVRAAVDTPGVTVRTGAELAAEAHDDATSAAESTRESLLAFAAVAVLVGMFVIANTFTMLVTQRVRQFALLRAVGATKRQVRRAVLLEAAVLGFVGATIGVALGIGLGLLGMSAFAPSDEPVTYDVSPTAVLVGYAIGIGVTAIAAYGSARRAAAVPPVAALRADATPPRRSTLIRTTTGTVLLAAGTTTVVVVQGTNLSTTERVLCMAAGIIAWLGVLLLAPVFASAVLTPLSRVLAKRGGPVTRLATRNAVRDPRRTAATASALLVGLALVCAFATLGETLVSTFGAAVRNMVPEDATVIRSASGRDPLSTDVLKRVHETPGVTRVAADRYAVIPVSHKGGTSTSSISAVEPEGFTNLLTPKITEGSADLHQGVVMDANQAAMMSVGIGDDITLDLPDDTKVTQRLTGLLDTVEGQPLIYVDVARVPSWFREKAVTSVYARGTDATALRQELERTFKNRPDVLVTTREEIIEAESKEFQLILSAMYAMFGAAVVIAIFGVINTLALSVTERTRELGILGAVGAQRIFIRRVIRLESTVICTYGGALGIVVGVLFGAIMQHAMVGNPILNITIPTAVIVTALAGMLAVGVLSALWPAHKAARTEILTAIKTD